MDRILQAPKSPSCMGYDYGLRVNILEDGEAQTGKTFNLNCATKLNFKESAIHKTKRQVHSAYKIIGSTRKWRYKFCCHRLLHVRPSDLGYIDTVNTSFPSDYISTCPEFTDSVRMFAVYEDEKHTAMIFSYNRSDFDGMTLEEASSLAGTQNVVNWRAGNPENGQFGVVDCSGDWGPPKWHTKEDFSQPIYTSPGLSPLWPMMKMFSVSPLVIDQRIAANEKMEEMDCATKLNDDDGGAKPVTVPNFSRKMALMLVGGTGYPQPPPRSAPSMQRFLREVKTPDDSSYGTEYSPIPAMENDEESAPFDKYAEIIAITTIINKEAGVMGWDINGHSGTFGIKCPICSEYLTEDEPKKKQ